MSEIIKELKGTDLISKSAGIINENFRTLADKTYIENSFIKEHLANIDSRLKDLEDTSNQNYAGIITSLDSLTDKIDNDFDETNIQQMIDDSIANSNRELGEFIKNQAGIQVSKAMSEYAKTSNLTALEESLKKYLTQADLEGYLKEGDIYTILNEYDFNTSASFTEYESNANKKFASATTIVANSKFYYEKNTDASSSNYGNLCLVDRNGKVTDFTGIGDFYEKGTVTVNGETKSVKDIVNPDKRPDDEALADSTILAALIKLCEQKFKTVSTEMATIRQEVGDGSASIDILAKITDEETGKDIAAAIFAYADKEGSKLILSGDNINLNAEKKLKLKSGTFELDSKEMSLNSAGKLTINSENLKLNDGELMMKGNIYATNQNNQITAGIIGARKNTNGNNRVVRFFAGTESTKEGDVYNLLDEDIENAKFKVYDDGHVVAKDIELVFNGNHTSIDEDGILHANGAEISGNVTANKIDVTSTNNTITVKGSDNTTNYTGNLTYETNISADNFRISVDGELKAEGDDGSIKIKKDENYLEFGILDEISNTNDAIKDENGNPIDKLYGVPSLIMYYKGKPFYLNPTCWLNKGTTYNGGNMRWMKQYDAYNYSDPNISIIYNLTYTSTSGGLSNSQGSYCIAHPDGALRTLLESGGSSDEVCRLRIFEWGENEGEKRTWLKTSGLMNDGDENEGVFTKKSQLGSSEYYGNPSFTKTEITEDTCAAFKNKVPNSQTVWAKCTFYYFTEWIKDVGEDGKDSIINKTGFPIKKICRLMHNIAKAQSAPTNYDHDSQKYCWSGSGNSIKINNFDDILPFTEKTITNNRFDNSMGDGDGQYLEIIIDYYPLFEINEGIPAETTKKIYGKCQIQMVGNGYNNKIQYQIYSNNPTMGENIEKNLLSVTLNLEFNFYLVLNNATHFSHLDEAQGKFTFCNSTDLDKRELLKNVIIKFFENDNIDISHIDPKDFSFSGKIETSEDIYEKSSWRADDAWDV